MTMATEQFQLGSVSTGTLRPEDLLPVFYATIANLGGKSRTPSTNDPNERIEEAIEILQELCPPFVYFGAHPGDGADFGFWPDWEALTEAMKAAYSEYSKGQYKLEEYNVIVQIIDSENIIVMDLGRNVIWSTV